MIKRLLKDNLKYLIVIIALIISFYFIKNSNLYFSILHFDEKIMSMRNSYINDTNTHIFKIFTFLGECYIPICIIVCIFLLLKKKILGHFFTSSYLFAFVVALITKLIINRQRPSYNLIKIPDPYSFPSGHTFTSIVFYILLVYVAKKYNKNSKLYAPIMIVIVLFVGLSRIYLGVHYLTDVLGGILLGIPTLLMFINIFNKEIKENII